MRHSGVHRHADGVIVQKYVLWESVNGGGRVALDTELLRWPKLGFTNLVDL